MNKNDEDKILIQALSTYGVQAQEMMLFEECGELINAVAKTHRNRANAADVVTELADVSIIISQMAMYYGEDLFQKEREYKLLRLQSRLNEGNKIP